MRLAREKEEQGRSIDLSDDDMGNEAKKHLSIKYLFEELKKEVSYYYKKGKLRDKVLEGMAVKISDGQYPVLDNIDWFRVGNNEKMPEDFDVNQVKRSDFVEKILEDLFEFSGTIPKIQILFIAEMFEDVKYDEYIQVDNFMNSLIAVSEKVDDRL